MNPELQMKQQQFNSAMALYESSKSYRFLGKLISVIIILLQIVMVYQVIPLKIGISWQIVALFSAFWLADFINGLVHLYMDNNDNYNSLPGPLIAAFHLHHRTPLYKTNPLLLVYFNESGSKIWLAGMMMIITAVNQFLEINSVLLYMICYFSIFSVLAEVAHYLCHSPYNRTAELLQKSGLLLNRKHHGRHHLEDNVNYAFLNGMSDGLINFIAKTFYRGYKNNTDRHFDLYTGSDTNNRE